MQVVPSQIEPVVLVTATPTAGSSLPMDGLMADQATSGLSDAAPMSGVAAATS